MPPVEMTLDTMQTEDASLMSSILHPFPILLKVCEEQVHGKRQNPARTAIVRPYKEFLCNKIFTMISVRRGVASWAAPALHVSESMPTFQKIALKRQNQKRRFNLPFEPSPASSQSIPSSVKSRETYKRSHQIVSKGILWERNMRLVQGTLIRGSHLNVRPIQLLRLVRTTLLVSSDHDLRTFFTKADFKHLEDIFVRLRDQFTTPMQQKHLDKILVSIIELHHNLYGIDRTSMITLICACRRIGDWNRVREAWTWLSPWERNRDACNARLAAIIMGQERLSLIEGHIRDIKCCGIVMDGEAYTMIICAYLHRAFAIRDSMAACKKDDNLRLADALLKRLGKYERFTRIWITRMKEDVSDGNRLGWQIAFLVSELERYGWKQDAKAIDIWALKLRNQIAKGKRKNFV